MVGEEPPNIPETFDAAFDNALVTLPVAELSAPCALPAIPETAPVAADTAPVTFDTAEAPRAAAAADGSFAPAVIAVRLLARARPDTAVELELSMPLAAADACFFNDSIDAEPALLIREVNSGLLTPIALIEAAFACSNLSSNPGLAPVCSISVVLSAGIAAPTFPILLVSDAIRSEIFAGSVTPSIAARRSAVAPGGHIPRRFNSLITAVCESLARPKPDFRDSPIKLNDAGSTLPLAPAAPSAVPTASVAVFSTSAASEVICFASDVLDTLLTAEVILFLDARLLIDGTLLVTPLTLDEMPDIDFNAEVVFAGNILDAAAKASLALLISPSLSLIVDAAIPSPASSMPPISAGIIPFLTSPEMTPFMFLPDRTSARSLAVSIRALVLISVVGALTPDFSSGLSLLVSFGFSATALYPISYQYLELTPSEFDLITPWAKLIASSNFPQSATESKPATVSLEVFSFTIFALLKSTYAFFK